MGCIASSQGPSPAADKGAKDQQKPGQAPAAPVRSQQEAQPAQGLAAQQRGGGALPNIEGLTYETFAELAVAHLQGAATKQSAQSGGLSPGLPGLGPGGSSPLANASMRHLRRSFMADSDHNTRLWKRTAQVLDRAGKGYVEWDDVEIAVRELGQERDQAGLIMDILQTITRSKVRLRHIFIALDKDGTGSLSRAEWDDGMGLLLGGAEEVSQADRDKIWEVLDLDKSGEVSLQEFLSALSVEDTWGLHPNTQHTEEDLKKALEKEKKHQELVPQTGNTAHKMVDIGEGIIAREGEEDTPRQKAARVILRFMRRAKAHSMFEQNVWMVTLRLLDLEDEHDLNTTEASSAADSDSDNGEDAKDGQSADVNAAVQELEVVIKDLLQRRLPPLPVAKAIIQAVTLLHQEAANVGYIGPTGDGGDSGRVVVVGDLHGQLEDLLLIFDQCGLPSDKNPTMFLFNGDFVDRGPYGVEVLLLLYTLKLLWPSKIFMNRGNHEAKRINEKYGFDEEVQTKYNQGIFKLMTKSFNALPLCHIVHNSVFVMHGGLSEEVNVTIADYNMINRFKQIPRKDEISPGHTGRYDRLFEAAMWSDPRELEGRATEPSKRGAGCHFGSQAVEAFLHENSLHRFVRSHEVYQPGYQDHHSRKTTTVFSASNYCGTDDNHGCYLVCTAPPRQGEPAEMQYMQYRVMRDQSFELRDEVRSAMGGGGPVKVSAKEDALRRLRAVIFCRRTELMHFFQQKDTGRKGKVYLDIWVEAMKLYCSPSLPWRCVQKHLVPMEMDGMIPYVTFLERFQNGLAMRWMQQWGKKMIRHMADRMLFVARQTNPLRTGGEDKGGENEPTKEQDHLSYFQMCEALRGVLPGLSEAAVYYLMALCDKNSDGFIDPDEFAEAVEEARADDPDGSVPGVLDLWDLASFDPPGFQRLQRNFFITAPGEAVKILEIIREKRDEKKAV
eukprot:Hpha_TRINITY_DN15730_c3_g7::TRINITY_DN15730_c3_g7_i1::g.38046::m.38046/K04460/PPP5C; serine/threonine-protein phosphatase 5